MVQTVKGNEAVVGAGVTINMLIEFLQTLSGSPGFEYTGEVIKHLKRTANTPVREVGTIGGNLMLKHNHTRFPSDIFFLLETVGGKLVIGSSPSTTQTYSPVDFLKIKMEGRLLLRVSFPKKDYNNFFRSFKIAKRYQNCHADLNAGFSFKVDSNQNFKVLEKPTICFDGIRPNFFRAVKTETALNGLELGNVQNLKRILNILENEIKPDHPPLAPSPAFRKALTLNLLYKTILGILGPGRVSQNLQSGATSLAMNLHSGKQFFVEDEEFKNSPLYKPVHKIEGLVQVSGEAVYVNDISKQERELYGTFVRVKLAPAKLKSINASAALRLPGVVRFLTAKDIPGKNSCYNGSKEFPMEEELFIEDQILTSGQAVGLILAETQEIANAAAKLVKVQFRDRMMPVVKVTKAVENSRKDGTFEKIFYPPPLSLHTKDEPSKTSKYRITGQLKIGSQAHMYMETHITLAVPKEGLQIYTSTQWPDLTQEMIASVLAIPNNLINVEVRRVGGAFGGKIDRGVQTACAAALGAQITGRPVRIPLSLQSNMEMSGKRLPFYMEYEVGFDEEGKIDALEANVICDVGMKQGYGTSIYAVNFMQSCYAPHGWILKAGRVLTNTPLNSYCRAPGSVQGIALIETIMEHIAHTLDVDPEKVRQANYLKTGDALITQPGKTFEGINKVPSVLKEIKKSSDYKTRKKFIQEFNTKNRWKKKGMSIVGMRCEKAFESTQYSVFVGIHHQDGTVSVRHGAIEMGQGLNTKVAQVVAHKFGLPLSKIVIKPTNNFIGINCSDSSGFVTSELTCFGALRACDVILKKIEPFRKGKDGVELGWEELIKKCYDERVDLTGFHLYNPKDPVKPYDIYGGMVTEVEIDVLTGEFKIVRLDVYADVGKSLSPEIDIGQIEGATVMGIGLWTREKIIFDTDTGRLLTRNTWEYKPPFPGCVPEDMRVTVIKNSTNPHGVLRSKAVGETPLCLTVTVFFAVKNAIKSARKDAGNHDWFELDGPVTPADVVRLCLTNPHSDFVF